MICHFYSHQGFTTIALINSLFLNDFTTMFSILFSLFYNEKPISSKIYFHGTTRYLLLFQNLIKLQLIIF